MRLYIIRLIHRFNDWDAEFKFKAPDARKARSWAKAKLVGDDDWLITSCTVVDKDEVATPTQQRDALAAALFEAQKAAGDATAELSTMAACNDTTYALRDAKAASRTLCDLQAGARIALKNHLPPAVHKKLR